MSSRNLERLTWVLIYGGLLGASLGWFVRPQDPGLGTTIIAAGAAAVVAGIVLIWVRSRRP